MMRFRSLILGLGAISLSVGAVAQEGDGAVPAEPATGPGSMIWHSQQQAYLGSLKAVDGWHWTDGGLRWRWVQTQTSKYGNGPKPTVEDRVTVHYEGTFIDGQGFDSSYERGEPANFPLGGLIEGWQVAIPQMSIGDTIEVAIPADLAYGPVGRGPIPGGATLLFKVELLGIGDDSDSGNAGDSAGG